MISAVEAAGARASSATEAPLPFCRHQREIWCRSSAVVSVRVLRPYHSRNAPPNADEGGQESLTDVPGRRRICARSGVRVFHASLRAGEEKKLKLLPPLDFSFASPDAGK